MFENAEIALDQIPSADNVEWQSLDAKYRTMQQAAVLMLFGIFAIPLTLVPIFTPMPATPAVIMWIVWTISVSFSLIWPVIALPQRGYVVRDKDLLFKKGLIWRSVTAVPFNRIQHVETSHSPLDRKFGLATLQLFTAGGTGGDLKIDGLAADIAEQLRVYILKKAGSSIEHAE